MVRVLQRQWGGNGIGSDSTPTTSSFAHASALASVAKVCGDPRNMFLSSEDRRQGRISARPFYDHQHPSRPLSVDK